MSTHRRHEMSTHTPEPWYQDGRGPRSSGRIPIFAPTIGGLGQKSSVSIASASQLGMAGSPGAQQANADRIIACVNACAGINPEAVPELLEALEMAMPYLERAPKFYKFQRAGREFWPNREEAEGCFFKALAAIAKARGQ